MLTPRLPKPLNALTVFQDHCISASKVIGYESIDWYSIAGKSGHVSFRHRTQLSVPFGK
jgi:hypothetical protein